LVGVNYGTFTIISQKIEVQYQKYLAQHPKRKCGIQSSLPLSEQLLLSLLYMRNYETFLKLGHEFGISESYAQKRYRFIKMLLFQSLDLPNEQALKEAISGNKIAIDVTEQAIERPVENQED
jgi:Helix-turn-helix of DDE superfamily endonuclease